MALLDHFHPPISEQRHWEAFHAQWAACIASTLNDTLPDGYFAEPQVHVGPRIEVDVASWDASAMNAQHGAVLVESRAIPQAVDYLIPTEFPSEFGVHVYDSSAGPTLVAAIELISPANKDREANRNAFIHKCVNFCHQGIGLIVVDVVTNRHWHWLDELIHALSATSTIERSSALSAISVRPVRVQEQDHLEFRVRELQIGHELPELPLALGGVDWLILHLDTTYNEACRRSRLA